MYSVDDGSGVHFRVTVVVSWKEVVHTVLVVVTM